MFPRAILLAGGKSSRFGSDKAVADIGGWTLSAFCLSQLLLIFERVLVVAKDPERLNLRSGARVRLVRDMSSASAALVGMVSGLKASDRMLNYIIGCDMPASALGLVGALHALARGKSCALRCDESGRPQPLGGFYSQRALPVMEEFAANGEFRLIALLRAMDVATLPFEELIRLDPDLKSFWNVNTQADLARVRVKLTE